MKTTIVMIACFFVLGVLEIGNAQESTLKTTPAQSFKAGGMPIVILPPTTEMSEVGYSNRDFMDIIVNPNNRLIAAFVPTNELPMFRKESDAPKLSKYAMVQVLRRGEDMVIDTSYFSKLITHLKEKFGDLIDSSLKSVEEEFNRRMKSLDLDEATMNLGTPVQLGCLFSKQNAYAFGMITPTSWGGQNTKLVMSCAFVRVKQRLLFVYLYADYKNEDTVKWLRKTTVDWVNTILTSNI
jgi:hypothetical protein